MQTIRPNQQFDLTVGFRMDGRVPQPETVP